jgi:hypothetical protein
MENWRRWVSLGLLALGLAGCNRAAPVRAAPTEQALCFSERPADLRPESADVWKPEALFALLLNRYDARTGQVAIPHTDCMGTPVLWQDPQPGECAETVAASAPLPPKPLTPGDLVVNELRKDLRLVWAVVRRYADGDGMGPVALVESTPRGLAVRALGVLRARVKQAKLRLEDMGGLELLMAEGDRCSGPKEAFCERSVRILPLRGNRFINEPLHTAAGTCASPALFQLHRVATRPLPGRWLRRYEYTASLSFTSDSLRMQEQMVVNDSDPREPETPARQVRKAQLERRIQVSNGRLVVDDTSLWGRLLEEGAAEANP